MKSLLLALGLGIAATPLQAQAPDRDLQAILLRMHADYVTAFVSSEGFGESRLSPMMRVHWGREAMGDSKLRVREVRLIGIAKHDPPVIYNAGFQGVEHGKQGPRLTGQLARALDPDEQQALVVLDAGKEIVSMPQVHGLRVIGAIRARNECLQCHRSRHEGDLLGALSYQLEAEAKPE